MSATTTTIAEEDPPFRWKTGHIPETEASFPSRLIFFWVRDLFRRASYLHKQGDALEQDDLLPLPDVDHGARISSVFEEAWRKETAKQEAAVAAAGGGKEVDAGSLPSKDIDVDLAPKNELSNVKGKSTKRFRRVIMSVIGRPFITAGFIKAFNTFLQFSFPLLLQAILSFIESSQAGLIPADAPWHVRYRGYWLSGLLFIFMVIKAMTENTYFHRVYRAGYQARVAVSVAVYDKSLRLANAERQSTTLGELINLMQVDATKIEMFIPQVHVLWDGLLQITGYMVILYTLIGWPCFIGMIVMVVSGPVQGVVMKKLFGLNRKMAAFTDQRVKVTNEALQGVQCLKMYTWEDSFQKEIEKSRNMELKNLSAVAYLRGFSRSYMTALPQIVAVVSFAVFAATSTGANIKASTLFAALSAFDQLRFPLLFYPVSLAQLAQAQVSAARVDTFLSMKEINVGESDSGGTYSRQTESDGKGEIVLNNATIYWSDPAVPIAYNDDDSRSVSSRNSKSTIHTDSEELESPTVRFPKPILKHVSVRVESGELCAVVGRVASGKSTLCSAVLNETLLTDGDIVLKGKVAYAAQSAWILNATLRDNILFGLPYDKEKYDHVLKACQLTYDLELLEDGDMTEIGEKGINLSGGQKQRISVARCAYSDADTIILDDPLSALDPEVGKKLFNDCILGIMKGKTILFVTNQLQYLPSCDSIMALGKGRVLEKGTFDDISKAGGEVQRILDAAAKGEPPKSENKQATAQQSGKTLEGQEAVAPTPESEEETSKKEAKGLVTKEERNKGAVSLSVYAKYAKAGGGYLKFACLLLGFVICSANALAGTSWVSFWTSDSEYQRHSQGFYLGIYAFLAITLGVLTYLRTVLVVRFGVTASKSLHEGLLKSILQAPQSFFDTTPIGRILSRFSKDFYSIDVELSDYLDMVLFMLLSVIVSISTIIFVTPWFGIAVLPLGILYFRFLNYFREVSRETKRLESISRSPVYAQFSETLNGLATIRAYHQPDRFMKDFEGKVDNNIRAWYCNKVADRWLSVRLESIGATIAGLAGIFATSVAISGSESGIESDSNFASLAGLSLTFAISITGMLNWLVRMAAQLEAGMNAVERVLYYTESIPQEAPYTSEELEAKFSTDIPPPSDPSSFAVMASGGKATKLASDWPQEGAITLKNLRMRYRSDTPLVLKGLNVSIAGGERIGVVGRTGSGKSSLLLTLLRLVEPSLEDEDAENYESPISIDGVDTLRIGLKELRSRLGIIPQNPVLFSGTIRSNIDPFDDYSDEQIWSALDRCGMKDSVQEMPGMLDETVAEYGENLSAGMRQMLVLGRALLKQCRILLLDEATSSVDYETDKEIQRTIREAFAGCTVLTIAHRINTIMDSDKILVMKDGIAEEFASPEELLQDENSTFSEIVRHAKAQS